MQIIDLQQLSLAGSPNPIAEEKILLWCADGTNANTTNAGAGFLHDGTTTVTGGQIPLFTLSANWPVSTKVAFEATIWNSSSSVIIQANIYDSTTLSAIASSQITTTATTATVVRSGQFTLTPGHQYDVLFQVNTGSGTIYICDASLIVFP